MGKIKMKISILCPSRGRPRRFLEMAESAMGTADKPENVDLYLAVDADDPTRNQYPIAFLLNQTHQPVSHLFNSLAYGTDGDILMAAADDVLFRTQGWDTRVCAVLDRFPDGLFIASPMNGDGRRRVNHWFTGRQWLDLFGWFMPAHFEHFCDDEWVQEVSSACGRLVYLDDVLVEHMHKKFRNVNGTPKSENDDTYRSKRERSADGSCMSDRDIALFKKMAPQLAADKLKLLKATM
jgi:hypothetical protein